MQTESAWIARDAATSLFFTQVKHRDELRLALLINRVKKTILPTNPRYWTCAQQHQSPVGCKLHKDAFAQLQSNSCTMNNKVELGVWWTSWCVRIDVRMCEDTNQLFSHHLRGLARADMSCNLAAQNSNDTKWTGYILCIWSVRPHIWPKTPGWDTASRQVTKLPVEVCEPVASLSFTFKPKWHARRPNEMAHLQWQLRCFGVFRRPLHTS